MLFYSAAPRTEIYPFCPVLVNSYSGQALERANQTAVYRTGRGMTGRSGRSPAQGYAPSAASDARLRVMSTLRSVPRCVYITSYVIKEGDESLLFRKVPSLSVNMMMEYDEGPLMIGRDSEIKTSSLSRDLRTGCSSAVKCVIVLE